MDLKAQGELVPSEDALPRLLSAMDAQVRLLLELESLRLTQRAAIEEDEPANLLALMDQRQALIDSLTTLDREIAVLRGRVESRGSRVTPVQRDEISRRATRVAQAIQRILAGDAEDGEAMERRRGQISRELADTDGNRRAVSAYRFKDDRRAGGDGPGAMFQDRRA